MFSEVTAELKVWLSPQKDDGEVDNMERIIRQKALFRVKNHDGLYKLVSNAIVEFMRRKRSPFPDALLSQTHFLNVPAWKRGIVYINLTRYVTGIPANRHWHKFGYENYKANIKMMDSYCQADSTIIHSGDQFLSMPKDVEVTTPHRRTRKRRTRDSFELSSPEMKPKSRKIICLLSSDSEDGNDARL